MPLASTGFPILDTLDYTLASQRHLPVTDIDVSHSEGNQPISKSKLTFFYQVTLRAIESYLAGKYTDFDAHTTSTCCHGISLLVQDLIFSINHLDVRQVLREGKQKIEALSDENSSNGSYICTWWIPEPLLNLARLYILGFAKKADPNRGILTCKVKLKLISPIGTRFCNQIVDSLQKHFSNLIAVRYAHYLEKMPCYMHINGVSLSSWGKYVKPEYLRMDNQGILYASSMFSMQVSLAYLIYSKVKVAIINDLLEQTGKVKARYISFFEGNGHDQMRPLTPHEAKELRSNPEEPIIVFGGCTSFDTSNEDKLRFRMHPWLDHFSSLILACDVCYPQFPKVRDDSEFNSTPIIPHEDQLKAIISKHSKVKGVSAMDPSLFCLTHIYTASVKQVLNVFLGNNEDELPISFIPSSKSSSIYV